jgi:hypothetical protein
MTTMTTTTLPPLKDDIDYAIVIDTLGEIEHQIRTLKTKRKIFENALGTALGIGNYRGHHYHASIQEWPDGSPSIMIDKIRDLPRS